MKKHISGTDILKGSAVLGCASIISKIIGVVYRIPLTNILGDRCRNLCQCLSDICFTISYIISRYS